MSSDQPRDNPSRFKRFVYELEVEVIDPWAVEFSEPSPDYNVDQPMEFDAQVRRVIQDHIGNGMQDMRNAGVQFKSGTLLVRPVNEDGNYLAMPLPAMSGRHDDGTFKETPGETLNRERSQE